jgi:hypothetical protein
MAVTTVRTKALNLSTSFAQAGLVFDDATRLLVGGLWQNAVVEGNQTPSVGEYTADIKAVTADLAAQVAHGLGPYDGSVDRDRTAHAAQGSHGVS